MEFEKLTRNKAAEADRLRAGRELAAHIIAAMAAKGVTVELLGSMQTGDVFATSDVDLLVTDCGNMDPVIVWYEIGLIEADAYIPVDVTFLDLVPEHSMISLNNHAARI